MLQYCTGSIELCQVSGILKIESNRIESWDEELPGLFHKGGARTVVSESREDAGKGEHAGAETQPAHPTHNVETPFWPPICPDYSFLTKFCSKIQGFCREHVTRSSFSLTIYVGESRQPKRHPVVYPPLSHSITLSFVSPFADFQRPRTFLHLQTS